MVEFHSLNNGDIFAQRKDNNLLLGTWLHDKGFGTLRLTTGGTAKVSNLTDWINHMVSVTK